ncbi:MAG: malate synthase G [Rhizomicrobium sp.]
METYLDRAGLSIAGKLVRFIEGEALAGTGIPAEAFWQGAGRIFAAFAPENRALLEKRDALQAKIDDWHKSHRAAPFDAKAYRQFLTDIGYLVPEPQPFKIGVENVDEELATVAGPQLVVPILNARFLLNAANARWGSLYDALYGTDAIQEPPKGGGYDAVRGGKVIAWSKDFLDRILPLAVGSHKDVERYRVENGRLSPPLADSRLLAGYRGQADAPEAILIRHNGLHFEMVLDRSHPIGRHDKAGLADILVEAAITTIADLEDSIAAVDAGDKVAAYANWLGLVRGDLEARFEKSGREVSRALASDRNYAAPDGAPFKLPGRSLMLIRNVGHLLTTPAVRLADGKDAPEGILDAIVTSLIGLMDLSRRGRHVNSRKGSIYIVKPKLHGPEEASFTDRLFDAVEDLLGLARHTIKIGVMDEERRTSANLAATIEAVKDRVVFINTGFLDRTGDEIHTSMEAGAMVRKGEMKNSLWLKTYEDRNVRIGLACGFSGKAQIGKGMWAMPDRMGDMLKQKVAHPKAGASTAWVPSPTAATLHALHYHEVDVFKVQSRLAGEKPPPLDALLAIPLARHNWNEAEVREELDNNAQGILGYVARWIDQGVGCSKVPDIHDVGLMEDRATLRISSQHLANWLKHGICTPSQIDAALARMAAKVDAQNSGDPNYRPMAGREHESLAFQAARALILEGARQPNGYTEPLLHGFRRRAKRESDQVPGPTES